VPGLPTPDPIREELEYHTVTSAVTKVGDPRTPGAWLQTIVRDPAGNPQAIVEAGGVTTATFTRVGGTGPDRFQIASASGLGGAVTALTYAAGTLESVTVDPAGANLREEIITDDAGRPVLRTGALGFEQTWSYDGPFLALATHDGDGHTAGQTFEYDDDGKVSAIRVGTPGSERVRTELAYDITGSLTKVHQIALDGSAATTTACQDVAPGGRIRETVSPEGVRTRYTHDGEGRVLSIAAGDLGTVAASLGRRLPRSSRCRHAAVHAGDVRI
jgi:YD repeat-containing protein